MDGKKWRIFIRWLRFDDLMTSYTDAGPRSWGGLNSLAQTNPDRQGGDSWLRPSNVH